ncbi:MAG: MFS transporter [Anaerolineae bacterium]
MTTVMNYLRQIYTFNRNAKLFLLSTLLNGLGLSLFVLLYNLYILSLGFHEDMIGTLTAIASMVAVVAAVPVGWVASRMGYKSAQILGIVGSAISVIFPLIWPTAEAFILCELIWGIAFTMVVIVGSPFITESSTEEERPYLFSLQFVLSMLTLFVGCLVGGQLPSLFGSWVQTNGVTPLAYQGALWIGTALLFASALPVLFMDTPRRHAVRTIRPRFKVRSPQKVMQVLLPGIIGAVGGGMFIPFVTVFWRVLHHLDDGAIGQIMAVSGLGMTIVGVVAPALSKRWGLVRVNVVSVALSGIALMLFGFSPMLMVALVAYLGRDALVNLSRPLSQQFQMDRSPAEERAAVSSLYTMGFNVAWGIGSWVSGLWQTNGQFGLVFLVSTAFYLVSALLWQWLFGRDPVVALQKTVSPDAVVNREAAGVSLAAIEREQEEELLVLPLSAGSPAE